MGFLKDIAGPVPGGIGTAIGGPVGGAIGSSIGGLITGNKARDAFRGTQFNPFSSSSPFGSVDFSGNLFDITPGGAFDPIMALFGQQAGRAGGLSGDPTQDLPPGLLEAFGRISPQPGRDFGLSPALASQFQQGAGDVLSEFQGFDRDEFANRVFDDLNRLAGRGEQNQAVQHADRLFGRRGAGGEGEGSLPFGIGNLAESFERARTHRGLTALDFAGRREQELANLAAGFTGQAAGVRGFNLGVDQDRFNRARSTFGDALNLLSAGRGVQGDIFNRFGGLAQIMQGAFGQLIDQARLGAQGGAAQSAGNVPFAEAEAGRQNAFGDAISSFFENFDPSNPFGKTTPTGSGLPGSPVNLHARNPLEFFFPGGKTPTFVPPGFDPTLGG